MRQLVGRGHRRDAQRLGDAAGLGEVGLQDGDRAVLDHAVELEARVMVFARPQAARGRSRRRARSCGSRAAGNGSSSQPTFRSSIAGHRGARVRDAVAGVGVGEDHELVAERLAHRGMRSMIALRRIAHAQLDRLVAGFEMRARFGDERFRILIAERHAARVGGDGFAAAAEQLVERPADRLAADVPQREVDAAHREAGAGAHAVAARAACRRSWSRRRPRPPRPCRARVAAAWFRSVLRPLCARGRDAIRPSRRGRPRS